VFEIGDDADDDQERTGDEPPPYEGGDRLSGGSATGSARSSIKSPTRARSVHTQEVMEEEEMEVVEVRHPVSRSDTILSIARKYAADVSDRIVV